MNDDKGNENHYWDVAEHYNYDVGGDAEAVINIIALMTQLTKWSSAHVVDQPDRINEFVFWPFCEVKDIGCMKIS